MLWAVLLCAGLAAACAGKAQDVKDAEWQAGQLCKGFKEYVHGYAYLDKMIVEMAENGSPEKALRYLNKAERHFCLALEHFQNAEGTREEAQRNRRIADLLGKGNRELRKADECLAKGDEGTAGVHGGFAMRHFKDAMDLMVQP